MRSPSSGKLRHSVVLEQRRQDAAPSGALLATYKHITTAWASLEGVGGAMYLDSVQLEEKITHRIFIRFRQRTDFDHISRSADGVVVQRFRVKNLRDPDGTRRWLQIEAEEIRPGDDVP